MTTCPVCRGEAIDCICEDGMISSELIDGGPATLRQNVFFWTVTIVALVPWALLLKGIV